MTHSELASMNSARNACMESTLAARAVGSDTASSATVVKMMGTETAK